MYFLSTLVLIMNAKLTARRRKAMGQSNGTEHIIFIHSCALKQHISHYQIDVNEAYV
jgi:hypothetical protein